MIIVDSSVWIDFFNGVPTRQVEHLRGLLDYDDLVVVGDLVMTEVLQGFPRDRDFDTALRLFQRFTIVDLGGADRAIRAARHYRSLRRLGFTPRKTIDTLIATACLDRDDELLYSDRDFDPFVEHLGLKSALKSQPS